jgi:hypothetical protein
MLAGLYLLKYASAPGNILPFLLAFVISGSNSGGFVLPLNFVAALEPTSARRLAPWCALTHESPITGPWLRYFTSELTPDVRGHRVA